MSDPGVTVSGGGSIAVDTGSMTNAARQVDVAAGDLDGILVRARDVQAAGGPGFAALAEAVAHIATARDACLEAANGLRTAAVRYGEAEAAATATATTAGATVGTAVGAANAVALVLAGPLGVSVLDSSLQVVAGVAISLRMVQQFLATGWIAPQDDPVLLGALRVALSSIDDAERGFTGTETLHDLLHDDPAAPHGSQSTAAWLAAMLGRANPHPAGLLLGAPRSAGRVDAPRDLAGLVQRIPLVEDSSEQVRIERYDGPGGRRWIVYIAGTVTFLPGSGTEPFDMRSNLEGVAHEPSASESAVIDAMRRAGVRPDEPVLLVGHSQGALDAVRVAQDGGFRVGGVVQVGGPTGQIALPADVPVLAAEHDGDLVPMLGGVAATGTAGLRRVVVSRSLPDKGLRGGPIEDWVFSEHLAENYEDTLRLAQASGDPRVERFVDQVQPFLDARDGRATLVRADRPPAIEPDPYRRHSEAHDPAGAAQ